MSAESYKNTLTETVSEGESIVETHVPDERAFVATDRRLIVIWQGISGDRAAERIQTTSYENVDSVEINALGQGPIDWLRVFGGALMSLLGVFIFYLARNAPEMVFFLAIALGFGGIGIGMYFIYQGLQREGAQVMLKLDFGGGNRNYGLGDSGMPFALSVAEEYGRS